VNRDIRNLRTF
jgi:hypothetical protein